ncbi:U-box domain containing [Cordyceps militaris]|uniref:U-box domain containing n=1 Tax=Cordyceps militaris TaxID=73501 RepID=A0A2H4SW48_CORMI|nr:U-box domain containing [Cordyceps militaris]
MSRALELKDQANRLFQNKNYNAAESVYSQAIMEDPKNAFLYTNRAMARLKLDYWDTAVADCQSVLAMASATPDATMKANYYLCQAQLALGEPEAALTAGLAAHAAYAAVNHKSLAAVTTAVLRAKKLQWEKRERKRVRQEQDLERDVLRLLRAEREADVAAAVDVGDELERQAVEEEAQAKEERLTAVFEKSRQLGGQGLREVPDWAIDDISFGFMVDPVMTKTGKSYERASIMEHLRRYPYDPLTREPLVASELRPNIALRQACEAFLDENGWAADW